MKLPNGYGNISKLTGKRRKPWRARKTIGWEYNEQTKKNKQIFVTIGYFSTRADALEALTEYNKNPYDIKVDSITFKEVYEKWSEEHFKTIVSSATRTWKSAYNHCNQLHSMRMKDIRVIHLESSIQNAKVGDATKCRMKSLFNLMYRYSMKHEIVDKNYAELCDSIVEPKSKRPIIPFSKNEIDLLWNNLDYPFVDMILIGIYSGWRPQELAILKTKDIDLENKTMFGGLKTEAGKNRYVPMHKKIVELVEKKYDKNNDFLFTNGNSNMTYDKYRGRFKDVMKKLKLNHKPHETRHTFITLAKQNDVDEYCLKLIVGHAINDITERVYTHRQIDQLKKEIDKIQ